MTSLKQLNQSFEIHRHLIELHRLLNADIMPSGVAWLRNEITELEADLHAEP
ncbi:hypothetical protein [Paenibacillus sp. RC84]|uniref:hypothetical protein n=1 Tax=Paenibacillus sp. RC84 TaxID=3156252 RepID=UPI0035145626